MTGLALRLLRSLFLHPTYSKVKEEEKEKENENPKSARAELLPVGTAPLIVRLKLLAFFFFNVLAHRLSSPPPARCQHDAGTQREREASQGQQRARAGRSIRLRDSR